MAGEALRCVTIDEAWLAAADMDALRSKLMAKTNDDTVEHGKVMMLLAEYLQ